jgi:hypothetical protein
MFFAGSQTLMATGSWIGHTVRKINEKLRKATFGCSIITKDRRKCSIAKWFGKALSKGLARTGIIAQSNGKV